MREILFVGAGGFLGAIARFGVFMLARALPANGFPWATFFVNASGCLVAGMLLTAAEKTISFDRTIMLFGISGFLGAFTTFSAFGVETLNLIRSGQNVLAIGNVLANVVFGVLGVWLGQKF